MKSIQPWYVDQSAFIDLQQSAQKTNAYILVDGGLEDYRKVTELYQRSPVTGYHVDRVEVVGNPALTRQFEGKVMVLDARAESEYFEPTWDTESNLPIRSLSIKPSRRSRCNIPFKSIETSNVSRCSMGQKRDF